MTEVTVRAPRSEPRARARVERPWAPIEGVRAAAYAIPTTKQPHSDGTLEWNSTTLIVVELSAAGLSGIGYTYSHATAAALAETTLREAIAGIDVMDIERAHRVMLRAVRNYGSEGIAACAISAVDTALWDIKAKLLGLPVSALVGMARDAVPVYGSGGFCSYSIRELERQLAGWVSDGMDRVKMKVGRDADLDMRRVQAARLAIGGGPQLMVDANGAYSLKQALRLSETFAEFGVSWFEEPISSDDLEGLHLLRTRVPSRIEIAAGEYGYHPLYFRRMLEARAVDVLQVDATRCLGITGFLKAAALCEAWGIPLSAHTAPSLHVHPCCATDRAVHLEYFWDHVRIEHMLFDGAPKAAGGLLRPPRDRPGLGIELRRNDAARYAV